MLSVTGGDVNLVRGADPSPAGSLTRQENTGAVPHYRQRTPNARLPCRDTSGESRWHCYGGERTDISLTLFPVISLAIFDCFGFSFFSDGFIECWPHSSPLRKPEMANNSHSNETERVTGAGTGAPRPLAPPPLPAPISGGLQAADADVRNRLPPPGG